MFFVTFQKAENVKVKNGISGFPKSVRIILDLVLSLSGSMFRNMFKLQFTR